MRTITMPYSTTDFLLARWHPYTLDSRKQRNARYISTHLPQFTAEATTDQLVAFCLWNDSNGEYDECTRDDLVDIITEWAPDFKECAQC